MSLLLLAHVVDGLVAAVKPVGPDVLPPNSEINTQLTDIPANWRKLVIRVLDGYIDPLMNGLPSKLAPGAPGGAAVPWNTEARIRQVMADPSSVVVPPVFTNTLPLSKVEKPDYKLRRYQKGRTDDVLAAFNLYINYVAAGRMLAASVTATKLAAKVAVRDLCALEAFLVRYSAAINAAADAGVSLAETLALYRAEGDLVAPMSVDHLIDRLPVNESLKVKNLGFDTEFVKPTLERALWSYPFKALASPQNLNIKMDVLPALGPARNDAEKRARIIALINWMTVIGGLDYLVQQVTDISPGSFKSFITPFMHDWRSNLGIPSRMADRETEFDAVFADLTCMPWPADVNGRVVVAPKTPVKLVSFALTLAMLLSRLNKTQGKGPFIEPHTDLKYLAYNLQHARSDSVKKKDRFIHLLASAAVAAAKSTKFGSLKLALKPLKEKPAPSGLPVELKKNPANDATDHVAVFDMLMAAPEKFLEDAPSANLLAEFVLRAEGPASTSGNDWSGFGGPPAGTPSGNDWSGFEENRGNLARYRKLLAFYTALLT